MTLGRKVIMCGERPCTANCGEGGFSNGFSFGPCNGVDMTYAEPTTGTSGWVPDAGSGVFIATPAPIQRQTGPGIDSTLAERGKRYGEFKDQAVYAQGFAAIALTSPNWVQMKPDQREALSVIFNKIGRILNGDPDYSDSWHDIIGYAKLVDDRLKAEGK